MPSRQHDGRDDAYLADHHHRAETGDQPGLGQQHARVDEHADRDEEQRGEQVAQRQHFGDHLGAVLRLGDHQASQKRAERQRQAGELGQQRPCPARARPRPARTARACARSRRGRSANGTSSDADDVRPEQHPARFERRQREARPAVRRCPPRATAGRPPSGTTARSCAIRMPSATRPWSAPSSPRSSSTFSATTVLDSASSAPRNTPCRNVRPSSGRHERAEAHRAHDLQPAAECGYAADPAQLAKRHLGAQREHQKATPISARTCTEWGLAVGPGVNGPMATPASR